MSIAFSVAADLAPFIANKRMYLLISSNKPFVTSDNPVTVCHSSKNHSQIYGNGGVADSVLLLPLNPSICLVFDNGYPEQIEDATDSLIDEVNYLAMFYADRNIFSNIYSDDLSRQFQKTVFGAGQSTQISFAGKTTIYQPKPQ